MHSGKVGLSVNKDLVHKMQIKEESLNWFASLIFLTTALFIKMNKISLDQKFGSSTRHLQYTWQRKKLPPWGSQAGESLSMTSPSRQ